MEQAASVPIKELEDILEFTEFWCALRSNGAIPSIQSFQLEKLERLAPRAVWSRWQGDGVFECIYAGSEIQASLGADITGINILDLDQSKRPEHSRACLEAACTQPCGIFSILNMGTEKGHKIAIYAAYLPLRSGDRIVDLIEISFPGEIGSSHENLGTGVTFIDAEPTVFVDLGFGVPELAGDLIGASPATWKLADLTK